MKNKFVFAAFIVIIFCSHVFSSIIGKGLAQTQTIPITSSSSSGGIGEDCKCPEDSSFIFNKCNPGLIFECFPSDVPFSPVCGCNGNTYENSCVANLHGVKKFTDGPCLCQNTDENDCTCPFGCVWDGSKCLIPPAFKTSAPKEIVCGCNGQTYFNEITAGSTGVKKTTSGICMTSSSSGEIMCESVLSNCSCKYECLAYTDKSELVDCNFLCNTEILAPQDKIMDCKFVNSACVNTLGPNNTPCSSDNDCNYNSCKNGKKYIPFSCVNMICREINYPKGSHPCDLILSESILSKDFTGVWVPTNLDSNFGDVSLGLCIKGSMLGGFLYEKGIKIEINFPFGFDYKEVISKNEINIGIFVGNADISYVQLNLKLIDRGKLNVRFTNEARTGVVSDEITFEASKISSYRTCKKKICPIFFFPISPKEQCPSGSSKDVCRKKTQGCSVK